MKTPFTVLCLTAMMVATATVPAPVKLERKVKSGDVHKGTLSFEADFNGQLVAATADTKSTIKEIKDDGTVVMHETFESMTMTVDGNEMGHADGRNDMVTYDKWGRVVNVASQSDNSMPPRVAHLVTFVYPENPVDIGDSWEKVTQANDSNKLPKTTFKGTVEAFEEYKGIKVAKVKYSIAEEFHTAPATLTGTAWINIENGRMVKAEADIKNFPGAPMPVDAKMKFEAK